MSESMPWLRQVWHVFAKDVRRHWWMLVVFVVHAFAGTLGAAQTVYAPGDSIILALLFFALPVTAAVLAAMVVIDDPPASAKAWWPTLALSRQAVFAGKLLFVLGLMPLVLIVAMILMHRSLDVSIADAIVPSLLGVRWIALLLVVTVAAAALARDLRAFMLAALLLLGVLLFSLNILVFTTDGILERLVRITPNAYSLAMLFMVGLLIFATSRVYARRTQTWHRVAVVLLLAPALLLVQIKAAAATMRPEVNNLSSQMEDATLATEVRRFPNGIAQSTELLTHIRLAGLSPEVQAAVYLPTIQLEGGAACRVVITLGKSFSVLQSPALPVPGAAVTWLGSAPNVTYSTDSVYTRSWGPYSYIPDSCMLSPRAELHLRQARFLGSLPVKLGASLTRHGNRVSLLGVNGEMAVRLEPFRARGWLTIGELSSLGAANETSDGRRSLEYVLLHPTRREAVQLQSAYYLSHQQRGPVSQVITNLVPQDAGATPETINATSPDELQRSLGLTSDAEFKEWLRGAELLVFEWQLLAVIDLEPNVTGARDVTAKTSTSGIR